MSVIGTARTAELLDPFGIRLNSDQTGRLLVYLDLLLKWNSKINLIGKSSGEECVTRHFGESLFLGRAMGLDGSLLDIGSGAGFPGLALKIIYPDLEATLLEPVTKKRAFLKEVIRICQFEHVGVLGQRLEDFSSQLAENKYNYATSRAVGGFANLIENAAACLKPKGRLCLWLGHQDASAIVLSRTPFKWQKPVLIPLSLRREILIGELQQSP